MRNERGGLADNAGGWFCFDDTNVTPWNVSKLDEDCFGGRYAPDTDHPLPNRVIYLGSQGPPLGSDLFPPAVVYLDCSA